MDPALYTRAANNAGARYAAMLEVLRGVLFASLDRPYSRREADALRTNAVDVGHVFLRGERNHIDEDVRASALDARRTVLSDLGLPDSIDTSEPLSDHLLQMQLYLETELTAQLTRDVEALIRRYRDFAIQAELTARTMGSLYQAVPTLGSTDRARFYFRDRGGRLFPSQRFVRQVWRHTLLSVGAESYLLESAARGANSVEVLHPSKDIDTVISLSNLTAGTTFLDVRDDLFHPNSEATLKVKA